MLIKSNTFDLMDEFKHFLDNQNAGLSIRSVKSELRENEIALFQAIRQDNFEDISRLQLQRSLLKDCLIDLLSQPSI